MSNVLSLCSEICFEFDSANVCQYVLSDANNIYTCINLSRRERERAIDRKSDSTIWEFYVCVNKVLFYYFPLCASGGRGVCECVCCRGAWQRQWHVGAIEFMLRSRSHSHSFYPSLSHIHTRHTHVELAANKTCCSLGLLPEFKLIEFMFDCVLNLNATLLPLLLPTTYQHARTKCLREFTAKLLKINSSLCGAS